MSEYQRIISYLYEYKNGVRGENIGFIRVETRSQQLKISFTLNASIIPGSPLVLYFYYYDHGKMLGIPWDEIANIPSHYEYKETFQLEDVFDETVSINDMDGILFYYNDQHYLGSQWNETPINLRVFEKPSKKVPQLEEYMEALTLHEQKVAEPIQTVEPVIREEKANISLQAPETDLETTPQVSEETPEPSSKILLPDKAEMIKEPQQDTHVPPYVPKKWEDYPQIIPCPTPDYSSCIKIQLKDFPAFPFLPQELTGNGFLKMQVQNYGHLLLGKKKLTDCHYIGVPGVFSNQRNFVAHLFGFPEFVTVPHQEQNTGNFGYWIMTIDH